MYLSSSDYVWLSIKLVLVLLALFWSVKKYLQGGQEIGTVSRQAELRHQMNEPPPEYSKVGGSPPAYDLVVAGNPPAYSEAIQLEINSSLVHQRQPNPPCPPLLPTQNVATTPNELNSVVVISAQSFSSTQ